MLSYGNQRINNLFVFLKQWREKRLFSCHIKSIQICEINWIVLWHDPLLAFLYIRCHNAHNFCKCNGWKSIISCIMYVHFDPRCKIPIWYHMKIGQSVRDNVSETLLPESKCRSKLPPWYVHYKSLLTLHQ